MRSLAAGPCGTLGCDRGSFRLQLVAWAARARSAHPVCAIVQTLQNRFQGLRPLITNIGTRALTFLVAVISTMTARGWGSSSTCATVSLEVPGRGCDHDFPALPIRPIPIARNQVSKASLLLRLPINFLRQLRDLQVPARERCPAGRADAFSL